MSNEIKNLLSALEADIVIKARKKFDASREIQARFGVNRSSSQGAFDSAMSKYCGAVLKNAQDEKDWPGKKASAEGSEDAIAALLADPTKHG